MKELGAVIYNCPCMAKDMGKLFDVYWYLGVPGTTVPSSWPSSYSTDINSNTSMQIQYNGTAATTYLSVSDDNSLLRLEGKMYKQLKCVLTLF